MLFIFGTRLFGKVDEVPGMFHVATRFFHIDYVPLFPVKSYVVLSKKSGVLGGSFNGVPIPLNMKSVVVAWGRAGAIAAIITALIIAGMNHDGSTQVSALITALLAVGAIAFTYKYKPFTHASYERACEIGRMIGMNERGIRTIEECFEQQVHGFPVQPIDADASEQMEMATPVAPGQATFFVSGRDTQSRQDVCITVWAHSEDEARSKAAAAGILVTAVEPGGAPA